MLSFPSCCVKSSKAWMDTLKSSIIFTSGPTTYKNNHKIKSKRNNIKKTSKRNNDVLKFSDLVHFLVKCCL